MYIGQNSRVQLIPLHANYFLRSPIEDTTSGFKSASILQFSSIPMCGTSGNQIWGYHLSSTAPLQSKAFKISIFDWKRPKMP